MPQPAITTEVHQALDIHGNFTAQIAFHRESTDLRADTLDFSIGQVTDFGLWRNPNSLANLQGAGFANSKNVG
jgi:hypothetical protein